MARGANRSLNGSKKAAVMMLALGEERAGPLWNALTTKKFATSASPW